MPPVVLHTFPISNFSEKGRALLAFKHIDYEIRHHMAGLPQRRLVALSGQRKVPVVEHAGRVISDSTRIAHYLDGAFPDCPRLIPDDEPRRSQVLALEDEIDETLGVGAPVLWIDDVVRGRRTDEIELLATEVHGLSTRGARLLGGGLSVARGVGLGRRFVRTHRERVHALLAHLAGRLSETRYLVGDAPTLADVAAAGLTLHLEWPFLPHLPEQVPRGRGVAGTVDAPELRRFFAWRRAFYEQYLG